MVDVICDTSFLVHLATRRVKNIDDIGVEIGQVSFLVPDVVRAELRKLAEEPEKRADAEQAIKYAARLGTADIGGTFADDEIVRHLASGSIVATMDRGLKKRVKALGCSVMSFSNDRIVLEG